ncbi:ABC transporter permease [Acidobacteriota bacterium]
MKKTPPKLPGWLVKLCAWYEDGFVVFGDVCEEYYEVANTRGLFYARLWFWWHCFRSFPIFISDLVIWRTTMFSNYIKVAFRNIRKQKGYAFINIFGLAIGMAVCILILLWVQSELSFDKYHKNANQISRITIDANIGRRMTAPVSAPPMGPALVREYPEVIQAARMYRPNRSPVIVGDKEYFESNVTFADNSIFELFSWPFLKGDQKTALRAPYTAVITEEIAQKYFGNEDPIGKTLRFGGNRDYAITGVVQNIPSNSHFTFDILRSMETRIKEDGDIMENWMNISLYTYVLLAEDVDHRVLEPKIQSVIDSNLGPVLKSLGGSLKLGLQPLTDIHLRSEHPSDIAPQGNIMYVYLFSAIAFFVLIIACINFINLSTARSSSRAQEVGMRKTLGAVRNRLIGQFLGESVLYSMLSLVFSIMLIMITLPWFNSVVGRNLNLNVLQVPWLLPSFIGLALVVGMVAGSYPAFFLSSFQPVRVLRGRVKTGSSNARFRQVLVIIQFAVSIILIIGTMVIYKQLNYFNSKKLGFDKEHVLVLSGLESVMQQSYQTLRDEFKNIPGVLEVGTSSNLPSRGISRSLFQPEGFAQDQSVTMDYKDVDPGFIPALGMKIVAGRNFSEEISTDQDESVIVNETAAKTIGWDDPVGKQFIFSSDQTDQPEETRINVIGVVEDFHNSSLREKIEPMILFYNPDGFGTFAIRIAPAETQRTIDQIKTKWKEIVPLMPFDFLFLDESFDSQYRAEERMGNLTLRFGILAIFIGCLGLFGMASYTTEQRTKEIGIRKALGASVSTIVRMLSKEYIVLVVIGNLIAWPAAYLLMKSWLSNFAYSTSLAFWVFAASAVLSLAVAILTVSYQSIRAALSNPADSLRYE